MWKYAFLESILMKLSNSEYNEKFIFKGGYIISNIVGLSSRSTVDIDFLIKNIPLNEELLAEILNGKLNSIEGGIFIDSYSYVRRKQNCHNR